MAESTSTLRVDHPDAPPELYFPRDSVRADLLADDRGLTRAGEGDLAAYLTFPNDTVSVVLIDAPTSDAEDSDSDVTIKRFPTWGDAADLIALLDVTLDADGNYTGAARNDWRRTVVEGSQILGQALVAAGRHSPGRRAVLASMTYPRVADPRVPVSIALEQVSAGRTFSTLIARGVQAGRTCAVGSLLLDATAPDLIRHAVAPPGVPGPYDSPPFDMAVTGRDLRVVDGAYPGDSSTPAGPPVIDAWVRFRDVPDDRELHAGLLAQFMGHMPIAPALRAHAGIGQEQAHRTISTAINAITLAIHADVRVDQWLLYRHHSTFAATA